MKSYNVWLALSDQLKTELWAYLWPEDGGIGPVPPNYPHFGNLAPATMAFFKAIYDAETLQRLFRPWNGWTLLSFYANVPEDWETIAADIAVLAQAYNSDFIEIGAWQCADGMQLGGNDTPIMPVPALTLEFMPDVVIDPGDPTAEPPVPPTTERPTQLSDVNLLAGQANRNFPTF